MGSGVAFGLEVSVSTKPEHAGKPIVTVVPGLGINKEGETLSLTQQTDVSLVQIEEPQANPGEFDACQPTQYSAYVKSDGVYLLTLCPAAGTQGRAPVMGLANQEARCNSKYRREGVKFRLHQLKLSAAELADRNKLRNLVAYKCFNPDALQAFVRDPFGAQDYKSKLLDGLLVPKLEKCEVPLTTRFQTGKALNLRIRGFGLRVESLGLIMEKRTKFNYLERFSFAGEITWRLCKAKPPKSKVFYVSWRHFQHTNQTP